MNTVANKLICLNLNAQWQPVGFKTVKDAIIALCASDADGKDNSLALDIDYNILDNGEPDLSEPKAMTPVSWNDWLSLPIRSWDLTISSPSMTIRVPTVIISANFSKMPVKHFKGKPSKDAIYNRDKGTCQYTGKKIDRNHATVDHVIPRSRGGEDSWTNLVLCSKDINTKKGNKLNSEIGLQLLKNPLAPQPVPVYSLIREAKHVDWKHFLIS
jgi:5-methylcytosine-specific restriction endonuclease McrA